MPNNLLKRIGAKRWATRIRQGGDVMWFFSSLPNIDKLKHKGDIPKLVKALSSGTDKLKADAIAALKELGYWPGFQISLMIFRYGQDQPVQPKQYYRQVLSNGCYRDTVIQIKEWRIAGVTKVIGIPEGIEIYNQYVRQSAIPDWGQPNDTFCGTGPDGRAIVVLYFCKVGAMKLEPTPAVINTDEDNVFVVDSPAIPGCVSQGITQEEAARNFLEARELCLKVRVLYGLPLIIPTAETRKNKSIPVPDISGREVIYSLERCGWQVARTNERCTVLAKEESIITPAIPNLNRIAKGALRSLLHSIDLTLG